MEQNFWGIIIAPVVTIIGFIFTYFLNKRNYKEEITKQKQNINLDKSADLPYKIQTLLDTLLKNKDKNIEKNTEIFDSFQSLMAEIFAYGSSNAISITVNLYELTYASGGKEKKPNDIIAYYILLLCQVKYDLTGIKINPQYWFRMRLTDYQKLKDNLNSANNKIVKEL